MNKYLVSIIVPCYNRQDKIEATILSLLNQSNKNFEIIIVDDGSTDQTYLCLLKFKEFNNISIYKIKNSERGAARNFGASKAKGLYLNFFDSDDLAKNNHIETASKKIQQFFRPEVFHLSYEHLVNEKKIKKFIKEGKLNSYIFKRNILSCNGVFIRSDIFFEEKFCENRDLSGSEDWDLWLRLANRFTFYGFSQITSVIIDHKERSMNSQNVNQIKKRIDLLLKRVSNKETFNFSTINKLKIKSELYSYMSLHFLTNNKIFSTKFLFYSILLFPINILSRRSINIIYKIIFK